MIRIGMSRHDAEPALEKERTILQARVEVAVLYAASEQEEAVWAVLDFMDLDLCCVHTIRSAVCTAMGIAQEHVHILTTHNHGGGTPDMEILGRLTAQTATAARGCAKPARLRYAVTQPAQQLNYTRRIYIPELGGKSTFWFGTSGEVGYNASPYIEHEINAIRDGHLAYYGVEETSRPHTPFAPADPRIAAILFETPEGDAIGSIIRYAAHVNTSNLPAVLTGDFPWYVRQYVEAELGGTAMYLNGPCADVGAGVLVKGPEAARGIGAALAETAVDALKSAEALPLDVLSDQTITVRMPVRPEVAENRAELPETMPDALPARRRYLERAYLGELLPFLREKYLEGEATVTDTIPVECGILRLGSVVIAAFPGETFQATGEALEEAYPGVRIVTAEEHGRTVMYMPPVAEFEQGGYESVCMATAPGAEDVLRRAMIAAVGTLCGEQG